jgi:Domain of unknown function (DUF4386)
MNPIQKTARIAGALYVAGSIPGFFAIIYIPGKFIVDSNPTATGATVLAHETLFRVGIVCDLVQSVIFIFVAIALYRLLSEVNRTWAATMVALALVGCAVMFGNVLNNIAALVLFRGGDFLTLIERPQLDTLGMFFIQLHERGYTIAQIFWGLWLLPLGLLVIRSRFLPWILGFWLVLTCFAYLVLSLTALLRPRYVTTVSHIVLPVLFGEVAFMLWLLIKGVKVPLTTSTASDIGPSRAT